MMPGRLPFLAIIGLAFGPVLPAPTVADMLGHGGVVRALAVSPDGEHLLSGGFDYTARVWNFVEQKTIAVLDGHEGPVTSVAWLAGERALTGSDDGTAILWDLASRKPIRRLTGHKGKVMAVAATADGRIGATGAWDHTARLWDLATGKTLRFLRHPGNVTALAFAPDGQRLVTGGYDGVLRVWRDGHEIGQMRGHSWVVTSIAVSPDGRHVLSASTDRSVRLWNLATLKEARILVHGDDPIYGVAFAPDGKTALWGGRDGVLQLWDLGRQALRRAIRTHVRPVWAVVYAGAGRFGVSAGSDGALRVWHLETGDRIGIPGEGDAGPKPWLTSEHPGARLYRKCAVCHSIQPGIAHRSGPPLAGLFGRRVGSVPGYNYSSALREANFQWDERTLFALFDKGPDILLPGTKMPVQRIPHSAELRQLIDYLRILTAVTPPGKEKGR